MFQGRSHVFIFQNSHRTKVHHDSSRLVLYRAGKNAFKMGRYVSLPKNFVATNFGVSWTSAALIMQVPLYLEVRTQRSGRKVTGQSSI